MKALIVVAVALLASGVYVRHLARLHRREALSRRLTALCR